MKTEGKGFAAGARMVTKGKGLEAKGVDERIYGEPSMVHLYNRYGISIAMGPVHSKFKMPRMGN